MIKKALILLIVVLSSTSLAAEQVNQKLSLGMQSSFPLGSYQELVSFGKGLEVALIFTAPISSFKMSLDLGARLFQNYDLSAGN